MSRLLPRHTHNPEADQRKLNCILGEPKPEPHNWWDGPLQREQLEPRPLTQTQRQPMSKWLRGMIIERDGPTCYLCGLQCRDNEIHIDHVIPIARGGDNHPGNLRVACRTCNIRKGKKMPADKPRIQSKVRRDSLPVAPRPQQPQQTVIERESKRAKKTQRKHA